MTFVFFNSNFCSRFLRFLKLDILPNEVFTEILDHVRDLTVFSVSRKFNEIATGRKFFGLHFYAYNDESKNFTKLDDDDDVFASIMKSKRRIDDLLIQHWRNHDIEEIRKFKDATLDRFKQVLERFGKDVKQFHFRGIKIPRNFVELLNLMPNVKNIYFRDLWECEDNLIEVKLELQKLRDIEIFHCHPNMFKFFDGLSPGVLNKLDLRVPTCYYFRQNGEVVPATNIKLFPNQHNIKYIYTDNVFADCFEWNQARLKKIDINTGYGISEEVMERILRGQDEVESLDMFVEVNEHIFNLVCKEVKSLVKLNIRVKICGGHSELSELRKLKFLDLVLWSNENVSSFVYFLQNDSLEKLFFFVKVT